MSKKLDNYFGISKTGSTVKTEVLAGITTFLAMCYILTVNPSQIFYAGAANPMWGSVFMATALGAIIGTTLMALYAKMPYAQAPGMGINATVGGLIGGGLGFFSTQFEFSFGNAMLITLISGVIFLLLTFLPGGKDATGKKVSIRERVFDGVPAAIRTAIPVGIGLFITFIGMQNAKMVVANQYTLTEFANLKIGTWGLETSTAAPTVVCLFGLLVIAVLQHFNVKGSVILGILAGTLLGIPLGVTNLSILAGAPETGVTWAFWDNFGKFFGMSENSGLFAALRTGFSLPAGSISTVIILVITFCILDMFDTMGTVMGCATRAGLLDKTGKPINYDKCMTSDAVATCTGALLGTSTVTTFVESGTGVAAGGRTGLTALTTAILFVLAIFMLPVFAFVPSAAAASALIYVGVVMMTSITGIDFKDTKNSVPAFITIIMMPFAYSISGGIGLGIISWVVINFIIWVIDKIRGKDTKQPVSLVMLIVTLLFLFYFLVPLA